jgi:hypothetical protein
MNQACQDLEKKKKKSGCGGEIYEGGDKEFREDERGEKVKNWGND